MSVTIANVQRSQFSDWLAMRAALYGDLSPEFHQAEMELIHVADDKDCFVSCRQSGSR